MSTDISAIVDYLFDARSDHEFCERFKQVCKDITDEERVAIHRSTRDGVAVFARLRDGLLNGSMS